MMSANAPLPLSYETTCKSTLVNLLNQSANADLQIVPICSGNET